jgi:FkbM family methyltransferase
MKNKAKLLFKRIRFYLSARNSIFFRWYYSFLYFPEKGTISYFLNTYSSRRKNDIRFIQIGANDGITYDLIHKFIKRDGWKGVLLEPQSYVFNKYLKKLYRKDKNVHPLNAAIGYSDETAKLYKIGFSNARWATGLATFNKDMIIKAYESGHVDRQAKKNNETVPEDDSLKISEEKVRVISPASLTAEYDLPRIDLLQIDAEGFDFEVIKMFDKQGINPRIMIFESSHFSDAEFEACMAFLRNRNYQTKTVKANTIAMIEPEGEYLDFFNSET